MRANHLKILNEAVIHRSQATLFLARNADWAPAEQATLAALAARLGISAPQVSG